MAGEPFLKEKHEINKLDRWWVVNILWFPKDQNGFPKREEPETPWVGRVARMKEMYWKYMREKGISEEAIQAEWDKAKVKYGTRSQSPNRPAVRRPVNPPRHNQGNSKRR